MKEKLRTSEEIGKIAGELRDKGKIIVTTNGGFDILHLAHIHLLEKAKNEGDVLIVLINSDSSIKRFKGEKRPIIPEKERVQMLAALEAIDHIVIFEEDNPLRLLSIIKPHIHVRGGSGILERINEEKELISKWNGTYKHSALEEGFSTTDIIRKILNLYGA